MKGVSWMVVLVPVAVMLAVAGFPPPTADAGTDTTPPTGTIVINNNRSATNTPNVTLALTWNDGGGGSGVTRMRFSNDGAIWSAWETPMATQAYGFAGDRELAGADARIAAIHELPGLIEQMLV